MKMNSKRPSYYKRFGDFGCCTDCPDEVNPSCPPICPDLDKPCPDPCDKCVKSRPMSRPKSRPMSRPKSRPMSRPKSRPMSRPPPS